MPASRGMMTRAASALLFAATLGFSLAFPGSAAESPGLSAGGGAAGCAVDRLAGRGCGRVAAGDTGDG